VAHFATLIISKDISEYFKKMEEIMKKNIFLILSFLIASFAQIQGRSITIENRSSKPVSTGLSYNFNGSLDPFTESFANNLDVSKIATFKSGLLDNEVNYNLDDSRKFKLDACKDDACKNSTAYLVVLDDKICEDTSKELQPAEITITNPIAVVTPPDGSSYSAVNTAFSYLIVKFTEERGCGIKVDHEENIVDFFGMKPGYNFVAIEPRSKAATFKVTPQSITINIQRIVTGNTAKHKSITYDPYVLKDLKPGQKIYLIADDSGIREDVNATNAAAAATMKENFKEAGQYLAAHPLPNVNLLGVKQASQ